MLNKQKVTRLMTTSSNNKKYKLQKNVHVLSLNESHGNRNILEKKQEYWNPQK